MDVIVLDIEMPGVDGLTALPDLIAAGQGGAGSRLDAVIAGLRGSADTGLTTDEIMALTRE